MRESTAPRQNPDFRNWTLRGFFLLFLMHSPTCRAAVRDLTAEWNTLTKDRPELSPVVRFHDLPAAEHIDDPLNAYIFKVRSIVANTLRCRVNGAPADWVCHALHALACDKNPDQGFKPDLFQLVIDVRMTVSTSGTGWVELATSNYPIGDPITIKGQPFSAFTSWEQLSKAAHERVNKAIDILKDEMASRTSSWPRSYDSGDKTRRRTTMPKLIDRLVEGEQMIEGDRAKTNTLLKELGLDPLKSMRPDSPKKS